VAQGTTRRQLLTGIVGRFAGQATLPQYRDRLPQGLDREM